MRIAGACLVLGFLLVVAGATWIYHPAGLLAAGLMLVWAGFLAAKKGP